MRKWAVICEKMGGSGRVQELPCPHLSEVSVRGYTHPLWSDRSGVRGALRPPPRHKRGSLPCGSRTLAIQKKGADAAGRIVCAFLSFSREPADVLSFFEE